LWSETAPACGAQFIRLGSRDVTFIYLVVWRRRENF
jgi:hypothetical protein